MPVTREGHRVWRVGDQVNKIVDYSERLFMLLLAANFLFSITLNIREQPFLVLLAISELLPVVLILIRRPGQCTQEWLPFIFALLGTAAPLMVRPGGGAALLIPAALGGMLMLAGLILNVLAKLALWRSFGLAPANRGVRAGGPYRFVRHPMYLGYFLTQLGFLLTNLTIGNAIKYLLAWSMQILRIREEEKFLLQDDAYRELTRSVRFRLVPGIY
jgi:protein-S-isoprenylcysteine O-methyltransferase Ste14